MLIETVSIFGRKPQTRTLAIAIAATKKVLVDIYAPSPQEASLYTKAAKLPPLSFIFTRSVKNTAWGADVVIIDSTKHFDILREIAQAANDPAILTFAGDLSAPDLRALKTALKETSLTYLAPPQLKRIWPDFPLTPL